MARAITFSCVRSVFILSFGLASLLAPCAYSSTTVGLSDAISTTPSGDSPGISGVLTATSYAPGPSSVTVPASGPVDIPGIGFGSFTVSGANSNVVPTFQVDVTPTIGSTTYAPIDFTGTLQSCTVNTTTCPQGYDISFKSPTNSTYTWTVTDPNNVNTYATTTFDGGAYTLGIGATLPITSGIKGVVLNGMIMATPAPEPISAGTAGFAVAALIGFAVRRKLRPTRG